MRVVVADTFVRFPALDGGSRAIGDLLRTLDELGHEVDLVTDVDHFADAVDAGRRWDVAFLSRPDTALRLAPAAREAGAKVVHLGHDLHHRRVAAEAEFGHGTSGAAHAYLALERQAWQHCDLSLYPDPAEVAAVDDAVGPGRAAWFPYFRVDATVPFRHRDAEAAPVFLGGAGHSPNRTALAWFHEAVCPLLRPEERRVEVIGDWPADQRVLGGEATFSWSGPLALEQLTARLAHTSAMIVPLRSGAGVKSKVVDALAQSVPLVTTTTGLQGLAAEGADIAWVDDVAAAWPDLLGAARSSSAEVERRCAAGAAFVAGRFGAPAFRAALEDVLADAD